MVCLDAVVGDLGADRRHVAGGDDVPVSVVGADPDVAHLVGCGVDERLAGDGERVDPQPWLHSR